MRRSIVPTILVTMLVLSGCGSDGDTKATDAGRTTSTTSSSTSTTTTTTTTAPCNFVGSLDAQDNTAPAVDQLLTDVTTTTDGCVDTITFTFRSNAAPQPGYRVEYADAPFMNSAGQTVTPAGAVFLKVRFQPAWIADLNMESAPQTYTGPRVITPTGMKTVRGLAMFDASEAVVGWVIGLDAQRPFAVEASSAKVVIKVG